MMESVRRAPGRAPESVFVAASEIVFRVFGLRSSAVEDVTRVAERGPGIFADARRVVEVAS